MTPVGGFLEEALDVLPAPCCAASVSILPARHQEDREVRKDREGKQDGAGDLGAGSLTPDGLPVLVRLRALHT